MKCQGIGLSQKGFSLIEMMIAMAITVFFLVISSSLHITTLRVHRAMEDRVALTQDSLLLVDYLRNRLVGSGGGTVRAWMALWHEDNCGSRSIFPNCNGGDRVTISTIATPFQECSITSTISNSPQRLQVAFSSPGVCCLEPQTANEVSFFNRPVMITLNDNFHQRYVTNVDLATCQVSLVPGQAAGGDEGGAITDWSGGMISQVRVETIYWDPVNRTLHKFADVNNDGVANLNEDIVVADNIFDFQISLGYDFNPPDGKIEQTSNGIDDEWLHNAPSVVEAVGTAPFLPPMSRAQLHLIQVGVILGGAERGANVSQDSARLFNGPDRTEPGWILQKEFSVLSPRNSFIFR